MSAWDPEIDTPASIVVIGGGPVGIEAALYARFLGYSVFLLEQGRVGGNLRAWGDTPLTESVEDATSSLGLAALEAQGNPVNLQQLGEAGATTCRDFVDQYLIPVAKTDLLYDSIQINSRVRSISRIHSKQLGEEDRSKTADSEFRVLVDSAKRGEYSIVADIVLDCSGYGNLEGLAAGGGVAVGESSLPLKTEASEGYFKGRVDVAERSIIFNEKRTVLWGSNHEACFAAVELLAIFATGQLAPSSRFTWVFPKLSGGAVSIYAVSTEEADPEDEKAQVLLSEVSALRDDSPAGTVCLDALGIESVARSESGTWQLKLQVNQEENLELECENFINCSCTSADWSFVEQLAGPTRMNADSDSMTEEPHYYVLGDKGLDPAMARGGKLAKAQEQIREAFSKIGGRTDLNLYKTVGPQS